MNQRILDLLEQLQDGDNNAAIIIKRITGKHHLRLGRNNRLPRKPTPRGRVALVARQKKARPPYPTKKCAKQQQGQQAA